MSSRPPLRVLLVKPYQPAAITICEPPLGILSLVSALRSGFGDRVEAGYRDLRLYKESPEKLAAEIAGKYDLVGISALNCEAGAADALAGALRVLSPSTLIALGGPYACSMPRKAMAATGADWIFNGEAERTFPQAVEAHFFGGGELKSVAGLTWRAGPEGPYISNGGADIVPDLDALPLPAWDLVPFDVYARRHNMNGTLRARRYAPLFTSRGCPYGCSYCHSFFGKRFRWRSRESVLEEIDLLKTRYGVGEFQIIDDIYNLHKPRMRAIAESVISRYGRRALFFTFPNGVRGDILDTADLPLLRDMGVYELTVAVETASARLQELLGKKLKLEQVRKVIDAAARAGISVKAFFMLGFPTETLEEMESTVDFAVRSGLTMAHFFTVIPQPGTPLYDLAGKESPGALEEVCHDDYHAARTWYGLAYNVDMAAVVRSAMLRFYLRPLRLLRILRRTDLNQLLLGEWQFLNLIGNRRPRGDAPRGGLQWRRVLQRE